LVVNHRDLSFLSVDLVRRKRVDRPLDIDNDQDRLSIPELSDIRDERGVSVGPNYPRTVRTTGSDPILDAKPLVNKGKKRQYQIDTLSGF